MHTSKRFLLPMLIVTAMISPRYVYGVVNLNHNIYGDQYQSRNQPTYAIAVYSQNSANNDYLIKKSDTDPDANFVLECSYKSTEKCTEKSCNTDNIIAQEQKLCVSKQLHGKPQPPTVLSGCRMNDGTEYMLTEDTTDTINVFSCLFSNDSQSICTQCNVLYSGSERGGPEGSISMIYDIGTAQTLCCDHFPWEANDAKTFTQNIEMTCTMYPRPLYNYVVGIDGGRQSYQRITEFSDTHINNALTATNACMIPAQTMGIDETGAFEMADDCYSATLSSPITSTYTPILVDEKLKTEWTAMQYGTAAGTL